MSLKQDRTGTRTSEDLRRRLNVKNINETGEKVDASVEQVQKLNDQVNNLSSQVVGLNDALTNTRNSYVSTNNQTFTEEQKTRARKNIGAGNSSFSGAYEDLSGKPTIPTKTSQLVNDSGFITDSGGVTPINVSNEKSNSTTDTYSCNYINTLIKETVIWTNPDITQEFATQQINMDLSKYKKFTVRWVLSSTNHIFGATEMYKDAYNRINTIGHVENTDLAIQRDIGFTNTAIMFTDCYGHGVGSHAATTGFKGIVNSGIIPYQIIGYE